MKIIPMNDCIFVKPDEVIDKTPGGIILSDFTKKRPCTGMIVAIGPKVDKDNFWIGRRILHGEFCGAKHIIEVAGIDTELFLMTERDILAVEVKGEKKSHSNSPSL